MVEQDYPGPGDLEPRPREGVARRSSYAASLEDPLAVVRNVAFPIVLRGYAREEVDAFVADVSELIAELDANRSPESAVRAALDRVGEETSGILQRAQEAADALIGRSRIQADDRLEQAEHDAQAIRAEADARAEELDQDIESLWNERARLIDEVRRLSDELTRVATAAAERMPAPPTEDAARPAEPPDDTTRDMPAFGALGDEVGGEPEDDALDDDYRIPRAEDEEEPEEGAGTTGDPASASEPFEEEDDPVTDEHDLGIEPPEDRPRDA